ncbi:MAG TPA: CYTH domain-containing protein [bacterium]|nr:CYTH domain-containing protein [bacterium]
MNIEYEATFTNINKDDIRRRLLSVGAVLIKKEFFQKRIVFDLPLSCEIKGAWLRVRDEGDRITMSLKIVDGQKISDQKEIQLVVDNFQQAVDFLTNIGCKKKAYQESKRELWILDEVEITIDEWPFLESFVEVEGNSEEQVKIVSEKIGFDYTTAKFCSVDTLYSEKYGLDIDIINKKTPNILFEMDNPFLLR